MKCPKCGTANGKTNKFCRECGLGLELLVPAQQVGAPEPVVTAPDEVGLGEELFKVWELLKAGDVDSALQQGENMVRSNPDSASAHSLVALIYERKAEQEFTQGHIDSGQSLLKRASAQYERIIDLNPDSTADREKLAGLRRRIAGGIADGRWAASTADAAKKTIDNIPNKPVLIAAGVTLALVAVLFAVIPGSGRSRPAGDAQTSAGEPADSRSTGLSTPHAPTSPPPVSSYSYQPTAPARTPLAPPSLARTRPQTRPAPRVEPATVTPALAGKELTLVAEPKRSPSAAPKPKPEPPPNNAAAGSSSGSGTGSKVLAQAIQLHNDGNDNDAVGAAQRAIALFQGDIDAGRNTDAAQRGIANARKLISVWERSAASTEEQ